MNNRNSAYSVQLAGVVCLAALLLSSCSGDPRPLQEAVEVSELGLVRLQIESEQAMPDNTVINPQQSIQFTFTAFDENNDQITVANDNRRWSVSSYDVADITDSGLLTGKNNGEITVGLRIGSVIADPVSVRVSSAELALLDGITGADILTECSQSEAYTATGSFTDGTVRPLNNLEWKVVTGPNGRMLSSNQSEAIVGALLPGTISLSATSGGISGVKLITVASGVESLAISPSPIEVERSADLPLIARASYIDTTMPSQNVTSLTSWEVEDGNNIASISDTDNNKGVLTGLQVGRTQVFADCAGALSSADVTVIEPQTIVGLRIEPDDDPVEMFVNGGDVQLTVFALSSRGSDEDVTDRATWRVDNGDDVVTVDNTSTSGGLVSALAAGRATIEASYANISQTISVVVR